MRTEDTSQPTNETGIQSVLAWLTRIDEHDSATLNEQLLRQLLTLRTIEIPLKQRGKLLDIFYRHAEKIVLADIPELRSIALPVPRRLSQHVRATQHLLEALAGDLMNSQAAQPPADAETLVRAMSCLAWSIKLSHLLAAPTPIGTWLQFHQTYNTARQLGIATQTAGHGQHSLQDFYLQTLLAAIAQPASFTSQELTFISDLLEHCVPKIAIVEPLPTDHSAVFWIDPQADFPAHALVRRAPPADTSVWFFSCRQFAREIEEKLKALRQGIKAARLALPQYADSVAGQNILQRLIRLWGKPGKRKFPRRRQSYRARLCSGIEQLWQLFQFPEKQPEVSEWMVTNESPDGYAIMHIAGPTDHVCIGEIVAIQTGAEHSSSNPAWHVCVVRWVVSENPEHLEFGLQVIATQAMAAELVQTENISAGICSALILPKTPPLRPSTAIIVKTGTFGKNPEKLIALLDSNNLEIRELTATDLEETTSCIEIFNVEPDGTA